MPKSEWPPPFWLWPVAPTAIRWTRCRWDNPRWTQFLNSGRDARQYGITTYRDAAGVRYEFANRPHPERSAQLDFAPPRNSRLPVVMAKSAITSPFPMLVDTSARQTWAAMSSGRALEYRVFAPATGEYPDHVSLPLPGYAGVGNKLILDKLHIESPIYFMPPAECSAPCRA